MSNFLAAIYMEESANIKEFSFPDKYQKTFLFLRSMFTHQKYSNIVCLYL